MVILLQIVCRVCQWKNFDDRSISREDMDKSCLPCFSTHGVVIKTQHKLQNKMSLMYTRRQSDSTVKRTMPAVLTDSCKAGVRRSIMFANFCGRGLVSWENRPMKLLNHDTRHFWRHDSDDKKWQTITCFDVVCDCDCETTWKADRMGSPLVTNLLLVHLF